MPNPIEIDNKPSPKFVLAREVLQASLISRVSTLVNQDPAIIAGEFLNGFPDSEFAATLECYPPLFDEQSERIDRFYKTVEGYTSDFFGNRKDLRILRMLLLANRAQIQVGKALDYSAAETEDVLSAPLLNFRSELCLAPTLHLDFIQAKTHVYSWTLGQFEYDQPGNWIAEGLPSRILYALAGITGVETDASRWSYEKGSYPVFLKNKVLGLVHG